VVSFTPPAALPPRKEPLVTNGQEVEWAPEPVWTRWWREKFPAPAGARTPIIQPVAQRYTTELSRAPHMCVCVCVCVCVCALPNLERIILQQPIFIVSRFLLVTNQLKLNVRALSPLTFSAFNGAVRKRTRNFGVGRCAPQPYYKPPSCIHFNCERSVLAIMTSLRF
jgi:hypothetical protein